MTSYPSPFGPPAGHFGPTGPGNVLLDPSGFVTADLTCRKCGYNLRGLSINGRCPECGSAVGLSAHGNLIRFSDPRWVRMLQRGARFIIYGVAVIIIGGIIGAFLAAAIGAAGMVLIGIVAVGGYLLVLTGWWQLTEPDPSGIGEDEYGTARKIIRITLILGVVGQVMGMVVGAAPAPAVRVAFEMISFVLGIAAVVGIFAQLQYLGKLSLRIPDDNLAARAQFLMYAFGISYAVLLVWNVAMRLLAGGGRVARPATGLACFGGIVGLTVFIFAVMYLFLIERLGKRFGEEVAVAEQTWASAEAAARAAPAPGAYPPSAPPPLA